MSKTEDNTPIDKELKAYLAGEDGVSAAYRQAGAEEPSAELDQLILAAARKAVQKDKPAATSNYRQRFSLAASFMVGVLVTSMYFNRESEFAETAATSAPREVRISQSAEQPAPAFAPAAPAVTAGDAQPELFTQDVSEQATRLGEQVGRAIASSQQVGRAIAPAPPERQEATQSKAEADTALADNAAPAQTQRETADTNSEARENANPVAESDVGEIAGLAPPSSDAAETADVVERQLEETIVTGFRIRNETEPDSSYRQSREEWLMRISALREEALGEAEVLEELNRQLAEELELFRQTYPDVDLDAELQALEQ